MTPQNLGNFRPGGTVDFFFATTLNGLPSALASGAVSVYKGNSTTESTSGVTLTASFDGRAGLNHVRITLSADATFYAAGGEFTAVLTGGTVDGSSIAGLPLAQFSIGRDEPIYAISSGTPTTTTFVAAGLTGANTDHYKDAYVAFLTGACAGVVKKITAFNAGTDTVTVDALPTAPSVGDTFLLVTGA